MKAARIYGKKDIRIEEIPVPKPNPNEVQIKVGYCGICGSDIHMYEDGFALPYKPHPLTGKTVPITEGHEFSGQITKLGSWVEGLKVGDRVAVEPIIACGHCENCLKGNYNFCTNAIGSDGSANFIGVSDDGGMAQYANVRSWFAHKIPDSLSYELGALVEPAAVAYEGIKRSGLIEGQTVAVMGAGPIGLMTAVLARIAGATKIYIDDVSKPRLAKAKELGFKNVLNPTEGDVVKEIHKTVPSGVDITFECAGAQPTFDTAFEVTKSTGLLQIIALFGKPTTVNLTNFTMKGINIHNTLAYNNSFPAVIDMVNEHQDLFKQFITKKVNLDKAVEAIKALVSDKSQVKILVSPQS